MTSVQYAKLVRPIVRRVAEAFGIEIPLFSQEKIGKYASGEWFFDDAKNGYKIAIACWNIGGHEIGGLAANGLDPKSAEEIESELRQAITLLRNAGDPNYIPDSIEELDEIDQVLQDVQGGCNLGEGNETGDPDFKDVEFYRSIDGTPCFDAPRTLIDRLLLEGRLSFKVETYPGRQDFLRRVYRAMPKLRIGKNAAEHELDEILDAVRKTGSYDADLVGLQNTLFRWHPEIHSQSDLRDWANAIGISCTFETVVERKRTHTLARFRRLRRYTLPAK